MPIPLLYANQLVFVLQDNFLFSGTIMENIRLSKPDCSEEDIIEASKLAVLFILLLNS